MRKICTIIYIFLGLFWGQLSFGLGSISLMKNEVAALPPSIRTITHCGSWKFGQEEGIYRLIIADVYGGVGSEVYVQFVANDKSDLGNYKILKTLDFPELNNDHNQYYFKSIGCKKAGKISYIQLKGTNEHDDANKTHHILIEVLDMEHYKIIDKTK